MKLIAACRHLLSEVGQHRVHAAASVFKAFSEIGDALATFDASPLATDDELRELAHLAELDAEDTVGADDSAAVDALVRRAVYDRGRLYAAIEASGPNSRLIAIARVARDIQSEKAECGEVSLALWIALDEALAALEKDQ